MKFTLQTLTPLWTAGTDPKNMDRVHETGIIGSLRWWYEAILRGLAGAGLERDQVCNPTCDNAAQRCNYEKHKRVCLACDLFGATGWKRRFRLEISKTNGGDPLFDCDESIRIKAPGGKHGWFFNSPYISTPNKLIKGQITLLRAARRYDGCTRPPQIINDLKVVAELINRWGALAAKTQHGFGVVDLCIEDPTPRDVDRFLRGLPQNATGDSGLPTIGNMFFAKLYLDAKTPDGWWKKANLDEAAKHQGQTYRGVRDKGGEWGFEKKSPFLSVPIAPAVKHKLRHGVSGELYLPEARKCLNYFFGTIKDKPNQKAKLNVSNAYKNGEGQWEFRIWGWFPEQYDGVSRDHLMTELHELVADSTKHQSFWDSIFGKGVIDLNQTIWREKVTHGHNRNQKGSIKGDIAPTNSADFLRCLLA